MSPMTPKLPGIIFCAALAAQLFAARAVAIEISAAPADQDQLPANDVATSGDQASEAALAAEAPSAEGSLKAKSLLRREEQEGKEKFLPKAAAAGVGVVKDLLFGKDKGGGGGGGAGGGAGAAGKAGGAGGALGGKAGALGKKAGAAAGAAAAGIACKGLPMQKPLLPDWMIEKAEKEAKSLERKAKMVELQFKSKKKTGLTLANQALVGAEAKLKMEERIPKTAKEKLCKAKERAKKISTCHIANEHQAKEGEAKPKEIEIKKKETERKTKELAAKEQAMKRKAEKEKKAKEERPKKEKPIKERTSKEGIEKYKISMNRTEKFQKAGLEKYGKELRKKEMRESEFKAKKKKKKKKKN